MLLSTRNLFLNQALLTGESYPVEKHAADQGDPAAEISEVGCVAVGCVALAQSASRFRRRCRRIGHADQAFSAMLGQLAATLIAKPPPTSFEIGLRRFSMLILWITLVIVVLMHGGMARRSATMGLFPGLYAPAASSLVETDPGIFTGDHDHLARARPRQLCLSRSKVIVKSPPPSTTWGRWTCSAPDKDGHHATEARIATRRKPPSTWRATTARAF